MMEMERKAGMHIGSRPKAVGSAPCEIMRSSMRKYPEFPTGPCAVFSNEERSYEFPLVHKIENKLRHLMEHQEKTERFRDEGYNSADLEEPGSEHGGVFLLDEELQLTDNADSFPEHLIQTVTHVSGPNLREEAYRVKEYEDLTCKTRCRHSGNMHVDPRELNSLYQRVSDYLIGRVVAREVPVVPTVIHQRPSLPEGIIPEEDETPGMRYMRQRLIEVRRRNLLGCLAEEVISDSQTECRISDVESEWGSPTDRSIPEPSTMFLFDEDELN